MNDRWKIKKREKKKTTGKILCVCDKGEKEDRIVQISD